MKYDGESTGSVFDCNTWIDKNSGLVKYFLGKLKLKFRLHTRQLLRNSKVVSVANGHIIVSS